MIAEAAAKAVLHLGLEVAHLEEAEHQVGEHDAEHRERVRDARGELAHVGGGVAGEDVAVAGARRERDALRAEPARDLAPELARARRDVRRAFGELMQAPDDRAEQDAERGEHDEHGEDHGEPARHARLERRLDRPHERDDEESEGERKQHRLRRAQRREDEDDGDDRQQAVARVRRTGSGLRPCSGCRICHVVCPPAAGLCTGRSGARGSASASGVRAVG